MAEGGEGLGVRVPLTVRVSAGLGVLGQLGVVNIRGLLGILRPLRVRIYGGH